MYTLVLLRHGESEWNLQNRFTGWTDVGLTSTGRSEAAAAGQAMRAADLSFTRLHTSLLKRAIHTATIALDEMNADWLPVSRHWRLNERHYGALQGLNKAETAAAHGDDQVFTWRRSYDVPPPPLEEGDPRHPRQDLRYTSLSRDLLPSTECLADVVHRFLPYWHDVLVPELLSGGRPLVVAHGNSIRAMVKHLDAVADSDIPTVNIPTGVPLVYTLDADLRPVASRYLSAEGSGS